MDDRTLKTTVIDELDWRPSVNAKDIAVGVDGGVVTLSGHVSSYAEKYDVETVVLGDFAVILEGFLAGRLLLRRRKWDVPDFEQLGRGEENHARGIVKQGVHEASLVEHDHIEAVFLGFDSAG